MKWALGLLCLMVQLSQPALAKTAIRKDVQQAITRFKAKDPALKPFFDNAAGYVVFPNVGKGGFIIGGAHGTGQLFEKGNLIGSAELIQASIGFQAGGQEFSEVIFFRTADALKNFKTSQFVVSAEASAIAAAEGAAAKAKYHLDVAIFVLPKSGVMVEASVGGQKFEYQAY